MPNILHHKGEERELSGSQSKKDPENAEGRFDGVNSGERI